MKRNHQNDGSLYIFIKTSSTAGNIVTGRMLLMQKKYLSFFLNDFTGIHLYIYIQVLFRKVYKNVSFIIYCKLFFEEFKNKSIFGYRNSYQHIKRNQCAVIQILTEDICMNILENCLKRPSLRYRLNSR